MPIFRETHTLIFTVGFSNLADFVLNLAFASDRVFILHPDKLPLERAGQQDWEKQQEQHLHYVALTRAKQELWFVKAGK
jgi:ATP-dependent exoDNAse (exonuclease V) beta subunit